MKFPKEMALSQGTGRYADRVEDGISRALGLVLADGRREATDAAAAARLWREAFRNVHSDMLLRATTQWLQENKRGRPSVGEIHLVLEKITPKREKQQQRLDQGRVDELRWAVSVLEDQHRYEKYQATLAYAQKCLKAQGFQDWRAAKSNLEPGWAPHDTREAYL